MASNTRFSRSFFSPKVFGLFLGLLIAGLFIFIGTFTDVFDNLETQVMDLHFNLKQSLVRESTQENVVKEKRIHKISNDIVLIGIDNKTLDAFGRWPFPRSYHADLLNSFTRIQDQNERESAVLLDILFNDVADRVFEDVVLIDAMKANGRVALQSQLQSLPMASSLTDELNSRLKVLLDNLGEITDINGDLSKVRPYYGIESPLKPYGRAIASYGHASYHEDTDKVFRRQQMVSRYSEKIGEFPLDEIDIYTDFKIDGRGHLGWLNENGIIESVELPLTDETLAGLRKEVHKNGLPRIGDDGSRKWYVFTYKDHYIPAISLTLALRYLNKSLDDIEVVYGSHILIPSPMKWDSESGSWIPYEIGGARNTKRLLHEIRIPIDENGNMLINFMGRRSSAEPGGIQTYPVRSYKTFASSVRGSDPETWPKTKALGGKVLMVGAFTLGMADDEKPTPLGLMFGVEIHANALNTIIMDNFIRTLPDWVNTLILLGLVLIFAFITSRMKRIGWSVAVILFFIAASFMTVTLLFEYQSLLIDWGTPIIAILVTFIAVVIYRVLTAERDRRQIKNVFGQFISPSIVDELSEHPPELGGEDVEVTVFFSDIRGFSQISERLSAQELVKLLNDYLTDMTDNLVNDYSGTLDKYIGDAIMAFWGAPKPQDDHAVRACKCALMQIRLLEKLNNRLKEEGGSAAQTLDIGIGLNSGVCMVGYMGSEGRKNYTAMGDVVNLASRLEGVNKTYLTRIILSEDTREKIRHEPFILRELDEIRVKGRLRPVTIYELIDYDGDLTAGISHDTNPGRS